MRAPVTHVRAVGGILRVVRARLTMVGIGAALALAGCGQARPGADVAHSSSDQLAVQAHPQVVEPVAGATPAPVQPQVQQPARTTASTGVLPQPVSLTQVRRQLAQSGISADPNVATLVPDGLAVAPIGAPPQIQEIINAGNQIALLGYFYGGGHGTFEDTRYDCSGSISFVLAAAHLLNTTETSGELESYGAPGRGKWVTIFANAGHTYMYVAGLRFDTVALAEGGSRWSNRTGSEGGGFAVRHPPGL
ncbi:MAG: peptidoglycan DL-endopeptidase RipB [Solirubrobacteraceae bacterium]|jgi:hypothetical protein|nr:peptidoglycan DL-endopeptidase RipB [Solirubrobacteraceae bacterium]